MIGLAFIGDTVPPDGEWINQSGRSKKERMLVHTEPVEALAHAPGMVLGRVECDNAILGRNGVLTGPRLRILKRTNASIDVDNYGRRAALQVINHWSAPQIVIDYLNTGNERLRDRALREAQQISLSNRQHNLSKAQQFDRRSGQHLSISLASSQTRSAADSAAWAAADTSWSATDKAWFASRSAAWSIDLRPTPEIPSNLFEEDADGFPQEIFEGAVDMFLRDNPSSWRDARFLQNADLQTRFDALLA